jgi:hypothetical protein
MAIVTKHDIEKLRKKGVEDADRVIKILSELNMIVILTDEKAVPYYGLISDFKITKYFPTHILNLLAKKYKNQSMQPSAVLKTLDLLQETFLANYSKKEIQKASVEIKKDELTSKENAKPQSTP